ncbi:MAG: hypothetical protein H7833_18890 [Magnetococcus sp. DMHC-1]|nr:hypothetical protein [Magnetococcales bacterium]
MTIAEEIYERALQLPENKAEVVLNFIGYLEMAAMERKSNHIQESLAMTDKLKTYSTVTIPVIVDEAPPDDWPEPIHVDSWDDNIDLSRNALYGDDGR